MIIMDSRDLIFISQVFIGDIPGFYSYKSGYYLVNFFNKYFDYKDVYKSGFPSRRIYVADKLSELFSLGEFDKFLNICLSKRFIISDLTNINETEALDKQKKVLEAFNKNLISKGYQIYQIKGEFLLKNIDENLEQIGDGGFADVFYNKITGIVHKKLKDELALDEGAVSRFKREYEITKSLQDIPNIIEIYDYNSTSNEYTMEYCDNNLYKYISQNNISNDEKISLTLSIMETMSNVHSRNIIHRDLSPTNILFKDSKIKIADFGLGKNLDMIHSHKTVYTSMFGQYYYCDPEQYMSLKEGDMQSDVYSLGRIINYIFTKSHMNSNHIFKYICEKATSSDRTYRYPSAVEMLDAIKETITRKTNADRESVLNQKLSNLEFDNDVEEWIYEMDGVDLCERIIPMKQFYLGVIKLSKSSRQIAYHIIDAVNGNYRVACKKFEMFDSIAYLLYQLLNFELDFEYKEKCCNIIHDIAYNVNRFSIQRMVDKLIDEGIDPLLENILKK